MKGFEDIKQSNTQKVKNLARHILEINKGKEVYLKDIRSRIEEELGRSFSPGMYSSAMRDLLEEEDGLIANPDRGIYMYLDNVKKFQINSVLDGAIEDLKSTAVVDMLSIGPEEIRYINKIPDMIKKLERMKIE